MNQMKRSRVKRRNVAMLLRRNDHGVALPMVLMVFIVGVALISAFLVAIVGSSKVTATSKSIVQSQAAAEAGIAAAQVHFAAVDPCGLGATVPAGTDPQYGVAITCNPTDTEVTFVSTGIAADGTKQKVEAVFSLRAKTKPPTEGGPGMFYTYGMGSRLNSYVFDEANSEVSIEDFAGSAGVYATTGNVACGTGSIFPSDVYTLNGNLQLDTGCLIEGNAYIGGNAKVNGGTVLGDLVAPKDTNHTISGTLGKPGVGGNVFTGGTVTVNGGNIHGSVYASGIGNSTLGSGFIKGNFIYKGSYGNWGPNIVEGSTVKDTALVKPTLPEIPVWQDVSFVPDNATTPPEAWASEGYKLVTVTGAACNLWSGNSADVSSLTASLSYKTIFDIRSCSGNFNTNAGGANKTVSVNQDVAVIANSWYLSGTKFRSSDGGAHTIFLITPDSKPLVAGPQCNSPAGDSQQLNDSTVDPKIAVYIYTPCSMKFNSGTATFRGQVYAGGLEFGGGVKIAFAPRSIPGYDFGQDIDSPGGGGSSGGGGSGGLGGVVKLISQRNIS